MLLSTKDLKLGVQVVGDEGEGHRSLSVCLSRLLLFITFLSQNLLAS